MKTRLTHLILAIAISAAIPACTTVTRMAQPMSYEPINSAGNQCKNECDNQFQTCRADAQGIRNTHQSSDDDGSSEVMQGCESSQTGCYMRCSKYNGGTFHAYRARETQISWWKTGALVGGLGLLLIIAAASGTSSSQP